MYVVIRKLNNMQSVSESARRAEAILGPLLVQTPGFKGYYIFDTGEGVAGSVTLFESREAATAANQQALTWIKENLSHLYEGEPEVVAGEVVGFVAPHHPLE